MGPKCFSRLVVLITAVALCATSATAGTATKTRHQSHSKKPSITSSSKASKHAKSHGRLKRAKLSRQRGQRVIREERAREIQEALIRAKYLDGEPTGVWDQRTKAAMARYQADNGWQTKSLPDARALIKLGLGPSHDDLLNPETAAVGASFTKTSARTESAANQ